MDQIRLVALASTFALVALIGQLTDSLSVSSAPAQANLMQYEASVLTAQAAGDAVEGEIVIDDTDAAFTVSGSWYPYGGGKYSVTTSWWAYMEAQWTAENLEEGTYDVWTSWSAAHYWTQAATFRVYDDDEERASVVLNQRMNPSLQGGKSAIVAGRQWAHLGTVEVTSGTLHVKVDNDFPYTQGYYVIADAVRIVPVETHTAPPEDDDDTSDEDEGCDADCVERNAEAYLDTNEDESVDLAEVIAFGRLTHTGDINAMGDMDVNEDGAINALDLSAVLGFIRNESGLDEEMYAFEKIDADTDYYVSLEETITAVEQFRENVGTDGEPDLNDDLVVDVLDLAILMSFVRNFGDTVPLRTFSLIDENSDFEITAEEIANTMQGFRDVYGTNDESYDVNADGTVNVLDLAAIASIIRQFADPVVLNTLALLDTNTDYEIDAEEMAEVMHGFRTAMDEQDPAYDVNESGSVEMTDLAAIVGMIRHMGDPIVMKAFEFADENGDFELTVVELVSAVRAVRDTFLTDDDETDFNYDGGVNILDLAIITGLVRRFGDMETAAFSVLDSNRDLILERDEAVESLEMVADSMRAGLNEYDINEDGQSNLLDYAILARVAAKFLE